MAALTGGIGLLAMIESVRLLDMKGESKHAFTLTELLVVVSVAGLLGSMLLAVSNDATQQLQAAACLNNMRQWGLGFMLYANDHNDYYPYNGAGGGPGPCDPVNTNAWFNVIAPYVGQPSLCKLYLAGTPPTPLTKGIWTCPSSTNVTVQPSMANPYFMYSMSVCWHEEGSTSVGFRRNQATSPATTILFCEEPEDNYPWTNGKHDAVTRHSGGSNFVFGDGHSDWLSFTNFCRETPGPPAYLVCPDPLGAIAWDTTGPSGDWKSIVVYHWWPFEYANGDAN